MPYADPAVRKAHKKAGSAKRYAKRKAAGLCVRCAAPAVAGKTQCAKCAAKGNACITKRCAERMAAGLCVDCDNPARSGKTTCVKCAAEIGDYGAKRYAKRREAGLCTNCPAPARKGKTQCADCAAKVKARIAERGVDPRRAERRAAATADMYAAQGGKCAGCQHPLPQRCLAIDHILPRSKGGSDDPSNLQLLCQFCNTTKNTRPQSYLLGRLREQGIIDAAGNNMEAV